ncbi:unnamed protein product [Microthlaspi erraticum]|uniref:C2 domain-containing protein n=1 Tax=Microthlaspi erraticum TaxID=1685480 RepID=A0A6D2KEP5_9BRAS|nr:unnamed protein product [Microthlaspi erraticum]
MIREGKRVEETNKEPVNIELILKIFQGVAIDERNFTQPYKGFEYCRVMAWTNAENERGTPVVKSYNGCPRFNRTLVIALDHPEDQYLYIELTRGVSWNDPRPSNGTTVMGRAKIKLPPRSSCREFTSRVDLVGLNSDRCVVSKGFLDLSMKLHRYRLK